MAFKKGDLSINIVIIAVIALLVLVVLSYIFVGKISQTRQGIDSCENAGGECKAMCDADERQLDKDCDKNGNGEYNEGPLEDGICCLEI
ncbi:MAG: hypothetical protein R6U32_07095 [Candidatus Woesearchaeota archaeon]